MTDGGDAIAAEESGGSFPKTTPLPGSLHREWRTCGKATCRCTRGTLHGPYLVRRWWEQGRQRKAYIARRQIAEVVAGIAAWQVLHPPTWSMRQSLAELRRWEKEICP